MQKAGQLAKAQQSRIRRMYKDDGSVLTETDMQVTDMMLSAIKSIFESDYNALTEEIDLKGFSPSARYTFVLDPIDGTDSYSQGLPSWCIALGVLDRDRRPVGGMVCAPRFGVGVDELFVRTDPDSDDVLMNGARLASKPDDGDIDQIAVGSKTFHHIDLSSYPGKIRCYGSSILHLLAPAVFSNIGGSITPKCYAWDVAAAHAIILKTGMDIRYADGSEFVYDDALLLERRKFRLPIVSGMPKAREKLLRLTALMH